MLGKGEYFLFFDLGDAAGALQDYFDALQDMDLMSDPEVERIITHRKGLPVP